MCRFGYVEKSTNGVILFDDNLKTFLCGCTWIDFVRFHFDARYGRVCFFVLQITFKNEHFHVLKCIEIARNFFVPQCQWRERKKTMSVASQHHGMNPVTPTFYRNDKNPWYEMWVWRRHSIDAVSRMFFCARNCKSLGLDFGFIFVCNLYFHREKSQRQFSVFFSLTREFKLCVFNVHAVYLARCDTYCRVCHKKFFEIWQ